MSVSLSIRAASALLWVTGVGFGAFCLPALRNLFSSRGIPYVMGFPAYGAGRFERHGMPTTVPMIAGFLIVCILECVAGWSLWSGQRFGATLAIAILPVGALFWWGFALPFPPAFALIRTILIVVNWQALR